MSAGPAATPFTLLHAAIVAVSAPAASNQNLRTHRLLYAGAVDSSGDAYVTGIINNTLPTTAGAFQTANAGNISSFVTKFNSTGSALVYSTYVTGFTNSNNFPTTPDAN